MEDKKWQLNFYEFEVIEGKFNRIKVGDKIREKCGLEYRLEDLDTIGSQRKSSRTFVVYNSSGSPERVCGPSSPGIANIVDLVESSCREIGIEAKYKGSYRFNARVRTDISV